VHDPAAALDYAARLRRLADEVADTLVLVMRVYFEKPRTSVGWKGSSTIPRWTTRSASTRGCCGRASCSCQLAELGLPTGSEALDPICPQYLAELITWYAIGARTTESQTHREMASGLSAPVGFKNGTDGGLESRGERHPLGRPPARLSSASTRRAGRASSARAAMPSAISCCAAAAGGRTTTP
jgi:3-deoxy-7-phosphoheptulonate synthase